MEEYKKMLFCAVAKAGGSLVIDLRVMADMDANTVLNFTSSPKGPDLIEIQIRNPYQKTNIKPQDNERI